MFNRLGMLLNLWRTGRLAWGLMRDGRVPLPAKLVIPGGLLYVLFPVDLLPDFFLALGQLDDLTVLLLSVMLFLRLCPPEVVREHLEGRGSERGRPEPQGRSGEVIDGDYRILE